MLVNRIELLQYWLFIVAVVVLHTVVAEVRIMLTSFMKDRTISFQSISSNLPVTMPQKIPFDSKSCTARNHVQREALLDPMAPSAACALEGIARKVQPHRSHVQLEPSQEPMECKR